MRIVSVSLVKLNLDVFLIGITDVPISPTTYTINFKFEKFGPLPRYTSVLGAVIVSLTIFITWWNHLQCF